MIQDTELFIKWLPDEITALKCLELILSVLIYISTELHGQNHLCMIFPGIAYIFLYENFLFFIFFLLQQTVVEPVLGLRS